MKAPLLRHYMSWTVIGCLLLGRHKGRVGYINEIGPYWICDNCGSIMR